MVSATIYSAGHDGPITDHCDYCSHPSLSSLLNVGRYFFTVYGADRDYIF